MISKTITSVNALKAIYTTSSSIMCVNGRNSSKFNTSCGIRQGAPSSALLFIAFINDLIDFVQDRCIPEAIIDVMHILLHADDTIVLSTEEDLFVRKCNVMIEYFRINKLKLNLGKSGFTCIGGNADSTHNLMLDNGSLQYKHQLKYLGILISDTGSVKEDVKNYVIRKRGNISSKFTNFCAKKFMAPLKIKLEALDTCVTSSITYSSET